MNEDNLSESIRYKFPNFGIVDQLEKMFVFDLQTCNVENFT